MEGTTTTAPMRLIGWYSHFFVRDRSQDGRDKRITSLVHENPARPTGETPSSCCGLWTLFSEKNASKGDVR